MSLDALVKRLHNVHQAYRKHFRQRAAVVVTAPGRVYVLGDQALLHGGEALVMTVDLNLCLAAGPRTDEWVVVHALNGGESARFSLRYLAQAYVPLWAQPVLAMARALVKEKYRLKGTNFVLHSTLPPEGDLGVAAALGLAAGWAWREMLGFPLTRQHLARLWEGEGRASLDVRPRAWDAVWLVAGRRQHLLYLNATLETPATWPLPRASRWVLALPSGRRRRTTRVAGRDPATTSLLRQLQAVMAGVRTWEDVALADLERHRHRLSERVYAQARYVVSERERVRRVLDLLARGDLHVLGAILNESHLSLREAGSHVTPDVHDMWETLNATAGCYGARASGGRQVLALVDGEAMPDFLEAAARLHRERTGRSLNLYPLATADGLLTL